MSKPLTLGAADAGWSGDDASPAATSEMTSDVNTIRGARMNPPPSEREALHQVADLLQLVVPPGKRGVNQPRARWKTQDEQAA